ncbi:EAL domain-containing protein [endosymbiont of unidentified scaly snail isolate Monju]|uniref:EAL domain-containing protein n=1 Tax=endosymbiont of unidentified scaly snail isolate Monju TaxID=1248727 RepID=UPI000389290C|nr:EAL domain-containing protein [endosymbiont of unidentified scaly snail isolate Monju]BAN69305.1 signal transduction protein [endosymbiont of unidentified scaly snail isolate Monju]
MSNDRLYELVILHEFSLAIGSSLDQQDMLNVCLPLMLRRLGGRAITLFEQRDNGEILESAFRLPRHAQAEGQLQTARKLVQQKDSPWLVCRTGNYWSHAWQVPGFGILVLLRGRQLEESMCHEIGQIAGKLSMALLGCRQYAQLRAVRAQLAREADLHRETLLAIGDAVITTDTEGCIQEVNPAAEQLLGHPRKHMIGHPLDQILRMYPFYIGMDAATIRGADPIDISRNTDGTARLQRPDQSSVTVQFNIRDITASSGETMGRVMVIRDISDLQALEQEVAWRATHDVLTGLPNRALLSERLGWLLAQADRHEKLLAVALVDLDEFKPVNDRLGHAAGDKLLCAAAQRMQEALRASDTLARLGGDEFVIILDDLDNMNHAEKIFDRLIDQLSRPFEIEDQEVRISASLGYTLYPLLDETDADTLLRHADKAIYQAKLAGRNCHRLFDVREQQQHLAMQQHTKVIMQALLNQEFRLHYQPKVDMRAGRILGFEGLARWHHPERGVLLPAHFLPWMQDKELACMLDRFVIGEACRQLVQWHQAGRDWTLSVNIAPAHLLSPDFLEQLDAILAGHPDLPPERLEFEILESAAISDIESATRVIDACHRRGISVALDDFGVGYASLAYLKNLPIDCLKIDRSFVQDMLNDRGDRILIESIIALARLFGQTPIAEGVEGPEQGVMLMRLGCDLAQGFGIARPMPAEQIDDWSAQWKTPELWRLWCDTPWKLDDLPLLAAQYDHLRWIEQVLHVAEGEPLTLSHEELADHHCCRLGKWYDTCGRQRYGQLPAFQELYPVHVAVHQAGREIVRLAENGQMEQARHLCARLLRLKDRVLHYLTELERQVAHQLSADNDLPDSLSPSKSKAS